MTKHGTQKTLTEMTSLPFVNYSNVPNLPGDCKLTKELLELAATLNSSMSELQCDLLFASVAVEDRAKDSVMMLACNEPFGQQPQLKGWL